MTEQKMRLMVFIIFFLLSVIVLLIVAMAKANSKNGEKVMSEEERSLPYEKKISLAITSENVIYNKLQSIIGENFIVLFKVSLKEFILVKKYAKRERIHLNMLEHKYIDFLVCDKNTMQPVCGIELEKQNNGRLNKTGKNEFIDKIYKVIGLEIIRLPEKKEYTDSYLRELLKDKLKGKIKS